MFDFSYSDEDLNFNIDDKIKKLINWEIFEDMLKQVLASEKANPVHLDTLYEYLKILVPLTVSVNRNTYGCDIITEDNDHYHVILRPEHILIKCYEELPSNSFIFDILKYTGKYNHEDNDAYDWEYYFELPEVLKDEHRDPV